MKILYLCFLCFTRVDFTFYANNQKENTRYKKQRDILSTFLGFTVLLTLKKKKKKTF